MNTGLSISIRWKRIPGVRLYNGNIDYVLYSVEQLWRPNSDLNEFNQQSLIFARLFAWLRSKNLKRA